MKPITKIVTRRQIVSALQKESLTSGYFFEIDPKSIMRCEVCAVGAVLRQTSFIRKLISIKGCNIDNTLGVDNLGKGLCRNAYASDSMFDVDGTIEQELNNKNYMGALSMKFESLMGNAVGDRATVKIKRQLIEFVKNKFPKSIKISLAVIMK